MSTHVKVLEGVFGKVVQRVGPIMADKEGILRVQAIITMMDGGTHRTAHLVKRPGGKWMMCLLPDNGGMQIGEVQYDGK